jgi:hypothetical protein
VLALRLIDAVLAGADEKDAGQHETHFDRRQGGAKTGALVDRDRMTDGEDKHKKNADPKEEPEDHQHSAQTAQERSEESPELKMGMQTKMTRTGTEMGPRFWTSDQYRSRIEDENQPNADSNQKQTGFTIFRQEGQTHEARMNRSKPQRKPNSRRMERR